MTEGRLRHGDAQVLFMLFAVIMLGVQIVLFVVAARSMPPEARDLRTFYSAGAIIRDGHAPLLYNDAYEATIQTKAAGPLGASLPFLYPPFAALLFVPLSLVSYNTAFIVFAVINLLGALIAAAVLTRTAALPCGGVWLGGALVLAFNPLCLTFLQGQVSVLLLLLFCGCQYALRREWSFVAGLILSLALVKFQIALPIAILFLMWRRWRVLQGFATGAAGLLAISAAVVGGPSLLTYAASVGGLEHRVAAGVANYGHFLVKMPNLYGLACLTVSNRTSAGILTAAASLALMTWAAKRRPSLSLAIIVALLVSYHLLPYDLTLLLLPLAVSAARWSLSPRTSLRSMVEAGVSLLLLLPPVYLGLESVDLMPLLVVPMLVFAVLLAEPERQAHLRPLRLPVAPTATA